MLYVLGARQMSGILVFELTGMVANVHDGQCSNDRNHLIAHVKVRLSSFPLMSATRKDDMLFVGLV